MLISAGPLQRPSERARLEDVVAWIDRWAKPMVAEDVPLAQAGGRVLAGGVAAALDLPPFDRAVADGFAVRAEETVGASAYNPLTLQLGPAAGGVAAGGAAAVESGNPLPAGADAIIRPEHAMPAGAGDIAVISPVFVGSDVEGRGSQAGCGRTLMSSGRRLDASDIGLLAAAGMERVPVVAKPRIRCVLIAAQTVAAGRTLAAAGELYDANGPLLAALVERDGGAVVDRSRAGRSRTELRDALALPGADIILVAGGTGPGSNDHAAAALAEAGELAVHGVAMRPGETAGAGNAAGVPVFLLPGSPADCLWAYELLAGRAIRLMAGRSRELPFRTETLRAARKIVSEVGTVEVSPVRRIGAEVEPIPSFTESGLAAAATADGFVLVPGASEGYPQGAPVTVYLRR